MSPALTYTFALLLTLAVEAPLVTFALARWYRVRLVYGATLGILASLLTHPIVWFVLPGLLLPSVGYAGYLIFAETFAWLAEALLLWICLRRDLPGMLLLSLAANLASFLVGALLQQLGAL